MLILCWFVQAHPDCPFNRYLEKVGIPSFLCIPYKQTMQKNVLFSVQGQGLWGWPTWSVSFVTTNIQMAGFGLLGMLPMQEREKQQVVVKRVAMLHNLAAGGSPQWTLCLVAAPGHSVHKFPPINLHLHHHLGPFLQSRWAITYPQLRV